MTTLLQYADVKIVGWRYPILNEKGSLMIIVKIYELVHDIIWEDRNDRAHIYIIIYSIKYRKKIVYSIHLIKNIYY